MSRSSDQAWIGAGVVLLTATALAGTIALAIRAEARDAPVLDFLAPLVHANVFLVAPLRAGMPPWGVAISLALEAALAAVVVAVLRRRYRCEAAEPGPEGVRWTAGEALGYGALIAMSLAFRFHAVNLMPHEWRGESWSHIAASTDTVAMMRRALRLEHPFISQGLCWYAIEHVWTAIFGTSFEAGRVLQASISFVVVPLLYGFLRRLAGPGPALLGAGVAAFSPVEITWSRNEFLFPYASAYAIVVAWTTFAAGESPRRKTLIVLSLEMALGMLVYPAARLLPVLPLVYLPFRWRGAPRTTSRRACWLFLAVGALLFLVTPLALRWMVAGRGEPVDLLQMDSGIGLWAQTEGLGTLSRALMWLRAIASNVVSLARSLLVLREDSWSTELSSLTPKTLLSPFTATFLSAGVVVALQRRRPRDLLLVLWIVLTLPPALLSYEPDARRFCTAFPAFAALAATTALEFFRAMAHDPGTRRARLLLAGLIGAVVAGEALLRAGLSFDKPQGRPTACLLARGLRPALTPGTLLIVDLKYRYVDFFEGKLFLELFDLLLSEKGRIVWIAPPEDIASYIDRPRADPDAVRGTALSRFPPAGPWERVVFVLRDAPESVALLARIAKRHPASRAVRWSFGSDPGCGNFFVVEAPLPIDVARTP